MVYTDKVLLASTLCCAFYGNTINLEYILNDTHGEDLYYHDMIFNDVLNVNRYLIINHDELHKHSSINSLFNDQKNTARALFLDHVVFRHRHHDCPKIDISDKNYHLLEYDGNCDILAPYITEITISILNYILDNDMLSEEHYKNVIRFLKLPIIYEEMAFHGSERYILDLKY